MNMVSIEKKGVISSAKLHRKVGGIFLSSGLILFSDQSLGENHLRPPRMGSA